MHNLCGLYYHQGTAEGLLLRGKQVHARAWGRLSQHQRVAASTCSSRGGRAHPLALSLVAPHLPSCVSQVYGEDGDRPFVLSRAFFSGEALSAVRPDPRTFSLARNHQRAASGGDCTSPGRGRVNSSWSGTTRALCVLCCACCARCGAGTQRVGPIWTGDNTADWHHLKVRGGAANSTHVRGFAPGLPACSCSLAGG